MTSRRSRELTLLESRFKPIWRSTSCIRTSSKRIFCRPSPLRPSILLSVGALALSAFNLAQDMDEAEATCTRKKVIANLCKVDLLVLEDLGMKRLLPTAAEDLPVV